MSETKPPLPKRAATFASARSPGPAQSSNVRQRGGPPRQSSTQNLKSSLSPPPGLDRRRSSILSYSSIDGITQSLAGGLLSPSTSRVSIEPREDEVTHWHSTPLAFAILPAVGGLLFKNGSAFVTDILLLGLAAIFMNWSIRLPWDWYYSAQVKRRAVDLNDLPVLGDLDENDETAVETGSSAGNSPKHEPHDADQTVPPAGVDFNPEDAKQESAAAELRRQEKLALLSTFGFPVAAAYLIHVIRGQLSTSSTGLVSDFNLSIFLLAAEIRPCRQLIHLVTNRTLHLQRTVTGLDDPFNPANPTRTAFSALETRISELEAQLTDHKLIPQEPESNPFAQKGDVADLSAELRKRYEPRLEGLERAMRRYEKRSTILAAQIDQRLGQMDGLLQDTLSLAAQAARQSQKGMVAKGLEGFSAAITMPIKVAWGVVIWPVGVVKIVYTTLFGWFGVEPVKKSEGKRQGSVTLASTGADKGKGVAARKQVR